LGRQNQHAILAAVTAVGATPIEIVKAESFPHVDGKALINFERAYDVMEEEGIDGLIALNWLNVYYLTSTVAIGMKFRSDFASFATFPRDRDQPRHFVGLVPEGWDMANRSGDELPELMPFSGAIHSRSSLH
jgi:hypothetical protein